MMMKTMISVRSMNALHKLVVAAIEEVVHLVVELFVAELAVVDDPDTELICYGPQNDKFHSTAKNRTRWYKLELEDATRVRNRFSFRSRAESSSSVCSKHTVNVPTKPGLVKILSQVIFLNYKHVYNFYDDFICIITMYLQCVAEKTI
jgi:hypothetical protein